MAVFEQRRRWKDQKMIARDKLSRERKANANVLTWVLPDVFLGQQRDRCDCSTASKGEV